MPFKYYLNEPFLDGKEKEYVNQVLESGWLSAGGQFTFRFEEAFARFIGVSHGLAVQSGTAALHTALLAISVKPDDKIVIPNYTCGACATAVLQTGAIPVIIDVDRHNFGMDTAILEEVLSTQKIKAVMVVHVYGFPCKNFDTLISLCKKYKAILLEDASEAHGAEFQGKKIGSFGDITAFSVRSEKMIGVGEGGLILTNNPEFHAKAHFYAARAAPHRTGKDPWWHKYIYTDVGMNYLLPHTLGAIGLAQLEKFPEILRRKKFVGELYRKLFQDVPEIRLQEIADDSMPCYWLNSIMLDKPEDKVRQIGTELLKQGIEIRPGFWPLGDLPAFKCFAYGSQEKGLYIFRSLIVLPSSAKLADYDGKAVREIVEIVKNTINKY